MKKEERILLISAAFWWLGEGLFGPLFAVFAGRVGGNILDVTWAWAIYLLVTGALEIYIGRVSDKIGQAKLMCAGYFLNAFLTFGYLFIHTPIELFLIQAGFGVALALADPTWDALYSRYEEGGKAGFIWGLEQGTESLITGASILIGGLIVAYFSFTTLFILMGVIQLAGAIYQARVLYFSEEKREKRLEAN